MKHGRLESETESEKEQASERNTNSNTFRSRNHQHIYVPTQIWSEQKRLIIYRNTKVKPEKDAHRKISFRKTICCCLFCFKIENTNRERKRKRAEKKGSRFQMHNNDLKIRVFYVYLERCNFRKPSYDTNRIIFTIGNNCSTGRTI